MEYLKSVIPSNLFTERGSNLVVINPGSANIRIGLASQDNPIEIPHCIARYSSQVPKINVQDQMLSAPVTPAQNMEREKAYIQIVTALRIPFPDDDVAKNSHLRKMGRIEGINPHNTRKEAAFGWTDVNEKDSDSRPALESSENRATKKDPMDHDQHEDKNEEELNPSKLHQYRKFIFGEEALKISPKAPYTLRRPIRRGHLNISQHYPPQQVFEDVLAIWDFILTEKLRIPLYERKMYSVLLVLPESFDSREIKELLTIVLRDLHFSSAVVHQESLAATFGNGLSTGCIVSMGAQVTSVICVEDGVALPTTQKTLPFGGEDISRCLLWIQRHHQTWPQIHTDLNTKPIDLLMLNRLKESYCEIKEGKLEAVAVVHSYEDDTPAGSHKTSLTALNVPPMGLFYPPLLVPDAFPPATSAWFLDHDDMLEDPWHMEYARRPDMSDGLYSNMNVGYPMWDNYPVFIPKPKKEEKLGLAEAITRSILSTGRLDLQRKLFSSIQLVGGVALTRGLVPAMEERVLLAIPSTEAIDRVEVLQSRGNPAFVPWKGGAILGVLDYARDGWIPRDEWIENGVLVKDPKNYKDSYYIQAQAMHYINS